MCKMKHNHLLHGVEQNSIHYYDLHKYIILLFRTDYLVEKQAYSHGKEKEKQSNQTP